MSRNRNIKRRLLKRQLLRILDEGSGDTMAGRVSTLSEVSDRIDARLRYILNQNSFAESKAEFIKKVREMEGKD